MSTAEQRAAKALKRARTRAYSHKRHVARCAAMRAHGIDPDTAWKWRESTPGTPSRAQWDKWVARAR